VEQLRLVFYILRRIGLAVFVLFGVLTITFILSHSIPGDPVIALLGKQANQHPGLVAAMNAKFHFNDPLWLQYYYYIVNLLHGNLGYSTSRGFIPVLTVIEQTLPYTAQIAFFAFVLSLGLGVLLGATAARFAHKTADRSIRSLYLAGVSSPPFFVAIILLILFGYFFNLLPTSGAVAINFNTPRTITGIPMLDSLLELNWPYFVNALEHVILPSLALALGAIGVVVRLLRASMLQVLQANYIRTARAKGLSETSVFFKHALRNAVMPIVTLSSLLLYGLITGTLFVENIFAYPGIGQYVATALLSQDYAGILATTLVFAVIIVVANLVSDILYAVVDPQVRLG
jgi:peptide/nickel transport system permease protein